MFIERLVSSSAFGQVVANAGSPPLGAVIFTQPLCPLIDALFCIRQRQCNKTLYGRKL